MNEMSQTKVDWTKIDTEIRHEGKQITLPNDPSRMPYDDAIKTLERVKAHEAQEFDVMETVEGAPWDAAVAIYRAMQDIYGVVISQSIKTFFGEIKPSFMTVNTGPGFTERLQVPVGQMTLPGVTKPVHLDVNRRGATLYGTVRRADRARLVEIVARARQLLREQSIYKAKAIRLLVDDDGDLNLGEQPEFLDLRRVAETDMIHTRDTTAQIATSLLAPLKHTAACRRNRVPLKRGILLEGKYGTGKSLTARVTAKVATDNGWTFLMLNRAQGLRAAIEFAKNYQPCVIFAEDIDRAADRTSEDVNDLVNLLDGLITKDMEMMVVLTTNFIEKIDKALLRPGRFDAIISIETPDAETAARITRVYAGELLTADADLSEIADLMAGMIPASIREVVERAKLSMLTEDRKWLKVDDLRVAIVGMQKHMALLNPAPAGLTDAQKFADGLRGIMGDSFNRELEGLASDQAVDESRRQVLGALVKLTKMMANETQIASAAANSAEQARENTVKILKEI